jgi:hypothetical protein
MPRIRKTGARASSSGTLSGASARTSSARRPCASRRSWPALVELKLLRGAGASGTLLSMVFSVRVDYESTMGEVGRVLRAVQQSSATEASDEDTLGERRGHHRGAERLRL